MHTHLNPIEKHKSQIEKRISLLQQKFKEKDNTHNNVRKLRDQIQDQNKVGSNQALAGSKTVEVRGKIKNQLEASKAKKEPTYHPTYIAQQPLAQTTVVRNTILAKQYNENKDEKMNQLYEMMRSILQGQKNIEKELNELKKQQLKESDRKVNKEQKEQKEQKDHKEQKEQKSFVNAQKLTINESIIENLSRSKEKFGQKSNKKQVSKNQSFLFQYNEEPSRTRQSKPKKQKIKKNCNFQDLLGELRGKQKNGERICVGEQWKGRIWSEVEERVKQSQKQYKDTIHRNNKHQFQHLMSTFQLQRKLKDQLIDKVYLQCNTQLYK